MQCEISNTSKKKSNRGIVGQVPFYKDLYDAGCNDYEIARQRGVTNLAVKSWRRTNGLPPNVKTPAQRPCGSIASTIRRVLKENPGANSFVLAAKAGCNAGYLRAFRQRELRKAAA